MSDIPCPECGHDISEVEEVFDRPTTSSGTWPEGRAYACYSCGCPASPADIARALLAERDAKLAAVVPMALTEFLLARIAEDERVACATITHYRDSTWRVIEDIHHKGAFEVEDVVREDDGGLDRELCDHIARWDPARVVADCKAKRAIIKRYDYLGEHGDSGDARWVLPLLAQPYADHPDFDPAWLA